MTFPFRRKPLALLICCGFTGTLAGGFAGAALAQATTPLRVDPVLLGLPPAKPAAAAPAEQPRTEVKPVEAPAVEAKPVEAKPTEPAAARPAPPAVPAGSGKASTREIPARAVAPQAAPTVVTPSRAPVPVQTLSPVVAVPARNPREAASAAVAAPAPRQSLRQPQPAPPMQGQASAATSMAPFRVDPALLGAASSGTRSFAATGGIQLAAASTKAGEDRQSWYRRLWAPVDNAYSHGDLEIYLPLHTHHLRSAYSAEKIATYQENPFGLGIGRGLYNEKGNWEGVYAMGFQDSHFKPQYQAGYIWKRIWRPAEDIRLGLGYTAFLMSRTDVFHYKPFPGIVPVASAAYKNLSLETTFIPGAAGAGNIFFVWAKWEFGKAGEPLGTPARPAPPERSEFAGNTDTPESGSTAPFAGADSPLPTPMALGSDAGMRNEALSPVDPTPALALRMSRAMLPMSGKSAEPRPVFFSAERMSGIAERETVAEGGVQLRKIGTLIDADRMTYWSLDDEIEAAGNVKLVQGENVVTGPKMRMKLEDQIGFFEQPAYFLKRQPLSAPKPSLTGEPFSGQTSPWDVQSSTGFAAGPASFSSTPKRVLTEAHGQAERIDFEGENQIRMRAATYTTCKPGNDDWYASIGELKLDYDHEAGEGRDGTIYFKGVPIVYSPWMSFSLNNQRKSGLLAPTFGSTSKSGFELTVPYYWNIAPNMDATLAPRVFTKRGAQLNSEFRYLDTDYSGQARVELLPGDKVRDANRYGISLLHNQNLGYGFSGMVNFNKVSDDNYYTDLSSRIANTSQTQLLQQGVLSYGGGGWWNVTANLQSYQTLQPDPANPVAVPYRLLPQITLTARQPDLFTTDSSFSGQYTSFSHPTLTEGQRMVLYPQVALPYVTPGWYVTPKIGVHATSYALSRQAIGTPDSITRTLPVFSIDSGMTFERSSQWYGRDYTQTLEPRLFYLNVPYRDQSNIPIFDSGLADFNFAQIFAENQFIGQDRVSDANQLTAAVTSRLIEPATGREIMRGMLGQRFYFSDQQVTLPAQTKRVWTKSDFLAAFSGQVLPKVYADAALQYNVENSRAERTSLGARYVPEPGKVLNAAYRFNRDSFDQVDFSGQWPIYGGWHGVGRVNYSLKDKQPIENVAGLEYNGGCWVVRVVGQRLATTSGTASSAFFVQLELNDFSRIGSNPLELLKRNIQGYGKINQSTADPVFGQ